MVASPLPSTRESDMDIEKQHPIDRVADLKPAETFDRSVINWDGDADPENPLNWSGKKKWTNGGLLAAMTLIT